MLLMLQLSLLSPQLALASHDSLLISPSSVRFSLQPLRPSPSPFYLSSSFSFLPEWTQIITKFLWEQLQKISDFHRQLLAQACASPSSLMPQEVEYSVKQWDYNEKLAMFMFQVRERVWLLLLTILVFFSCQRFTRSGSHLGKGLLRSNLLLPGWDAG